MATKYPIRKVRHPAVLSGRANGRLPAAILVETPGQARGPRVALVEPAARAWRALTASAKAAGFVLKATSLADSYRPYAVQERLFRQRYTTTVLPGRSSRVWNGRRWYLKPGQAKAAVPGTSNHGLGLAVDTGQERDSDAGTEELSAAALRWLIRNEETFGFSHELQDESWHIRYFTGDRIPPAVLAFEGDGARLPAGMHADPVPGAGAFEEEDDVTPQQFLDILHDPSVARAMRALSWQYQDAGDKSAHDIVLGEYRLTLRQLQQATEEIRAKMSVSDTEIGPVLADMAPEAVAGLILASLPVERARIVAATLVAGLGVVPAPID